MNRVIEASKAPMQPIGLSAGEIAVIVISNIVLLLIVFTVIYFILLDKWRRERKISEDVHGKSEPKK